MRALKYFGPDAPRVAAALGLMLAGVAFNVLKPWPFAFIVDCVLDHRPPPHWFGPGAVFNRAALLAGLSAALLLLYILQSAVATVREGLDIVPSLRGLPSLRGKVFVWLQRLSPPFRHNPRPDDPCEAQTLMACLDTFLPLAVMLIVMACMNIYLTLLSLVLLPLAALTLRSFDAKMRAPIQPASRRRWELARRFAVTVIFALGTSAMAWVGAVQVAARHLTVGELLVFLAYLVEIFEPLLQASRRAVD